MFWYTISGNFTASQRIKVDLKVDGFIPAGINGYPLVLTNNFLIIGSDGQRHCDLLYYIFIFFQCYFCLFNKFSLYVSGSSSIL